MINFDTFLDEEEELSSFFVVVGIWTSRGSVELFGDGWGLNVDVGTESKNKRE